MNINKAKYQFFVKLHFTFACVRPFKLTIDVC